jgi:Zn-dependent metalloprotease
MLDVYSMQRLIVLLGCILLFATTDATAQQASERALPATLSAAARAQVLAADTALQQRTRAVPGGRIDARSGVQRAAYRLPPLTTPTATPEAAARAFFRQAAPRFGWQPDARDLTLQRTQEHPRSTHLTYQQTVDGVPVYGRYVKVNLNADGQPTMALSSYAPRLKTPPGFSTQPALSAAEAQRRATQAVTTAGATTTTPDLVVFPSDPPRLAWRLLAWPDDAAAEWEVLIDARSGDVLYLVNQATHAHGSMGSVKRDEGNVKAHRHNPQPTTRNPQPETHNPQPKTHNPQPTTQTDGTGLVFDPDPLTTAGVDYGAPYVDANDTDVPELNAERLEVTLRDITQGDDGLYRLVGPYARVDGSVGQNTAYTAPAESAPDGFQYPRSDQHFEAVMVYYHIDKSQRYLQALDLGRGVQDGPIRVNPHGLGTADNSQYQPGLNLLQFGDGGIDDAEDADVIWHEYAHALLEGGAPGLLGSNEGRALHEGWADYWAASYSRHLEEEGIVPGTATGDWRKVFTWDGNEFWDGRRLDSNAQYPGDLTGNIYTDGLLWATTLMEVYDDLGRTVTDRLNLLSHAYLSPGVTLSDAANAIIQADTDYYDGAHVSVLLDRFGDRGLVDPSTYGPALAHDPVGYQPEAGATVTFAATATATGAAIASVRVTYRIDGGTAETVALNDQGDGQYRAAVTFPETASRVTYYVEAADGDGRTAVLPTGAPDATYAFYVGPDTEPPQITHTPIATASLQAWPPEVAATVEDNLNVGGASVAYALEDASGQTVEDGTFDLDAQDGTYAAPFPITADKVAAGHTVRYRITARDGAEPPNETTLPADGSFSFPVVSEGVLASYDFEVPQGTATGAWTHGAPTYFLQTPHSGSNLWSTGLAAAYPGTAAEATLTLPPVDLSGLNEAYLVFWHWYDIENDGSPGTPTLWDGANVEISTDGGTDWYVEEPFGGYTGTIDDRYGNPMGGEPGWGGYSYGWQRVVVPLPTAADVRVRFAFGTDTSNSPLEESLAFAGWHIDDAAITTERPVDATSPTVTHAPPAELPRAPGLAQPQLFVRADDDTGVASVFVQYTYLPEGGSPIPGTERLAMRLTAPDTFTGRIPVEGRTGDRVEYRFTLQDATGNATTYPADGEPPLAISYADVDRMAVLPGANGLGAWQATGDGGWAAAPSSSGVSQLTLSPVDLPTDAKTIQFALDHTYRLSPALGGNVKVSVDGGPWQPLRPVTGYTLDFAPGGTHPMAGEPVFTGRMGDNPVQSVFDLSDHAGREVRLRLDLGATRGASDDQAWIVDDAMLLFLDIDTAVDTEAPLPTELALHPNYPNPFADRTTIRYALPAPTDVHLDVYNLLGQRVATLVDAPQPAGTHTATLHADGLASGVYLLRLRAGGTHRTARIIVAR